jgi:hypothetical protein
MHQTAHPRFRILVSSLLLGLVSILAAAASVLADGGGGSSPADFVHDRPVAR